MTVRTARVMQCKITDGQNQTKKTPKPEAVACWNNSNNSNKAIARISHILLILYSIKFRDFNLRVSYISRFFQNRENREI